MLTFVDCFVVSHKTHFLAYPRSTRRYECVGVSGIGFGATMNVLQNYEVEGQNSQITILDISISLIISVTWGLHPTSLSATCPPPIPSLELSLSL